MPINIQFLGNLIFVTVTRSESEIDMTRDLPVWCEMSTVAVATVHLKIPCHFKHFRLSVIVHSMYLLK